jgi:hypothetical protein
LALGLATLLPSASARASPYNFTGTLTISLLGNGLTGLKEASRPFSGVVDLTRSGGQIVALNLPAGVISQPSSFTTIHQGNYAFVIGPLGPSAVGVFGIGRVNLMGRMAINGGVLLEGQGATNVLHIPLNALGLSTTVSTTGGGRLLGAAWSATATGPHSLNLVAPIRITTNLPDPNLKSFDLTGQLRLEFVPEPPAPASRLGVAILGIVWFGRRKLRTSTRPPPSSVV